MTNAEAAQLVNTEIRTRYKTLNDTQFGDWVYAVQYHTVTSAIQIIHDLVQHPELTLTLKAFKRLAWERRSKQTAQHKEFPGYDAWIRCIEAPADHPTWAGREWFRTDGFRRNDCGNAEYVRQFASDIAHEIQIKYGGAWCGVVKPLDNTPYSGPLTSAQRSAEAQRLILDGPDSPGRRWLLNRPRSGGPLLPDLKSVPPLEKAKTVAGREIIDRMRNYKPAPAASLKDNSDLWASKAGDDLLVASPGRPLGASGTYDLPPTRPTAGGRAYDTPKVAREPGQEG